MIHFWFALFFSVIFAIFLTPKALGLMGYDRMCSDFLSTFCYEMIIGYWICVIELFLEEKVFLIIRILLYIFIFAVAIYSYYCLTM